MNIPTTNPDDWAALLEDMQTITLAEMEGIRLMDRVDSKYVASTALLPQLLAAMRPSFRVQINDGLRIAHYATQYFDTPDLAMFLMHQNGKLNRQKIRIRSYLDSDLSFLEVKNKNNKGRTHKRRIPAEGAWAEEEGFLQENSLFDVGQLEPSLANRFYRMTFVNYKATERITIDTQLSFSNYRTGDTRTLNQLMIIELKQDGLQASDFRDLLLRFRIKKTGFSKYCMGTALTNSRVKANRFKSQWAKINKLIS
jgi:hypothetical protein